jgi:hypothetical protein
VQQRTGTYKGYHIVARFIDPNSDRFAVTVAQAPEFEASRV